MDGREIRIRLVPSRRVTCLLCALHLLAISAVAASALPAVVVWVADPVLLCGLAWHAWTHALANRHRTWLVHAGDGWRLESGGVHYPVALHGGSTLLGPIVLLLLRAARRRQVYVLTRDALGATDWRRLRVLLRFGTATPHPGARIVSSGSGAGSG
ncbi:MAG TPA: hypothetical protein PKZ77_05175 [Pseudomonadales bacterium]|nr:hypothetical protein [Pseudomonadales bacterium]HNC69858.1 hypothetical protein [Pseudomonadales bacterium]HND13769.1 hypothetical protein [Pseudomonadales bacterium]